MKILIISQMHDVMLHLVKSNPHISKVYLANVSLADKLYYGSLFKKHGVEYENVHYHHFSEKKRTRVYPFLEPLLKQSIEYLRLTAEHDMQKIMERYADLFLNFEIFFTEHDIDATCTWNGQRIFDLVINYHAKKCGCKTIYYEMGLFRPDTLTIDAKGVNVHNSVPREIDFYKSHNIKKSPLLPRKTATLPSSKALYTLYKLFDHFLARLNLKTYKRFDNLYRFTLSLPSATQTVTLEHLNPSFINIFCPLQVSHDTQILLNSPHIKSMEMFFDVINATALRFAEKHKKVRFYLKAHPKETQKIVFDFADDVYILDPNVSSASAVEAADLTLTINSTVGLEAVAHNKPCVTLAETFYSIEPIAFYAQPEKVTETVEKALQQSDPILQNNLIDYLKQEYQLHYNPFTILSYENQAHHQKFMELANEE